MTKKKMSFARMRLTRGCRISQVELNGMLQKANKTEEMLVSEKEFKDLYKKTFGVNIRKRG